MNKYIFLDFDGVLNSYRSDVIHHGLQNNPEKQIFMWDYTNPKWDPIAVGLLLRLVMETGAKIVVSSSWRQRNTLDQIHVAFWTYFWDTNGTIIGVTPSLPNKRRGREIDEWLEAHHPSKIDVKTEYKYVILDDAAPIDFLEGQPLVQTDPSVGLSYDNLTDAIRILND